jgi:small subunit ribosomal protein S7
MARRRRAETREVIPDAKYGSTIVTKFINSVMKEGKKAVAESAFYEAITVASEKMSVDPIEFFEKTLGNIRPSVEVRSRRVGGATYQVPCDVRPARQTALAIRWLINAAKARKDKKSFPDKLASEFMDAFSGRGAAFKKKEDTHKMAESNRAFAHYNW